MVKKDDLPTFRPMSFPTTDEREHLGYFHDIDIEVDTTLPSCPACKATTVMAMDSIDGRVCGCWNCQYVWKLAQEQEG